jgi:CRISPR type I-E-associated protein CasB/Cse2
MQKSYPRTSFGLGLFLSHLQEERNQNPQVKARVAKLRHAAENPALHEELFSLLDEVIPNTFQGGKWQEDCFLSVPCLFALHLRHTDSKINLGDSFRKLRGSTEAKSSLDTRFNGLLSADSEEVYALLRPLIMRLANEKIEVNFVKLYDDLCYWNNDTKNTQRAWAKGYYRPKDEESDDSLDT